MVLTAGIPVNAKDTKVRVPPTVRSVDVHVPWFIFWKILSCTVFEIDTIFIVCLIDIAGQCCCMLTAGTRKGHRLQEILLKGFLNWFLNAHPRSTIDRGEVVITGGHADRM